MKPVHARRTRLWALLSKRVLIGAALLAPLQQIDAQAQQAIANRAFDLEQAGKFTEAIAAWRAVIAAGDAPQGVLGLERIFSQIAQDDSVLPALDTLLARHPTDRILRGVQLRVLRVLGRERAARQAFEEWTTLLPGDPVPYREYAGQLLSDGRSAAADTVLQEATRSLGSTKALLIEVAQLRAALGLWHQAALSWRDALEAQPYLEQAAVYSLARASAEHRDSVRVVLRAASGARVRRVLGALELQWGAARDGWRAIAGLTAADSAYESWKEFADDAERQGAWLAARDALAAMHRERPSATLALRAAAASLSGHEPGPALDLLHAARRGLDSAQTGSQLLPLEVRALTLLGRPADAEARVKESARFIDESARRAYSRQIAWGWIRSGEVDRAQAALGAATVDDEDESGAWIALYHGDLARARTGLRRPAEATAEVVTVVALLARTRADSSVEVGAAFFALARGDSAQAAARFERAADELSDAAPLLLAIAARVQAARRQDGLALPLWQRIAARHAAAPEAAEADLEWGRALRRRGDAGGAAERFEHLILSYPQSALVPQARRELVAARTGASVS